MRVLIRICNGYFNSFKLILYVLSDFTNKENL